MENEPKSKSGKKLAKKWKMALGPKCGKKWPKNGEKMGLGVIFLFFAIFPLFQAEGHFLFFGQFYSHFWISARFPFYLASGSFARGRCRRGQSEIPHFCSKLLLFALVLYKEVEKSGEKGEKCVKKGEKCVTKTGKSLRPHLHQPH